MTMYHPSEIVYVPKRGTFAHIHIHMGSGIIGRVLIEHQKVHLYYEGNIYGSESMKRFEDKLFHAWGRMVQKYPTVAQMVVSVADVVVIGAFDPNTKTFHASKDAVSVTEAIDWIGDSGLEEAQARIAALKEN